MKILVNKIGRCKYKVEIAKGMRLVSEYSHEMQFLQAYNKMYDVIATANFATKISANGFQF